MPQQTEKMQNEARRRASLKINQNYPNVLRIRKI